ncbi:putative histidine kinase 1 [Nymphon striatum]|nr:putative histidine kinase 1 [Nymphon striatum]
MRSNGLSAELQMTQEPIDAPVGSGCHLLIADDTEVNRVVALTQLERLGHTGVMVNDGQQALDRLLTDTFDAVLMDWHMPELDGLQAARAYYAHCAELAIEPIPIIMMTANVSDSARETCAEAGTVDFLPKPVSLDALRACLEQWLPRSPGAEPAASSVPSQFVDRAVIDQMSDDLGGADALVPVIEAFIADSDERRAAVQPGPGHDRAEARRASHTLKSTAALLGADPLAKLSKELETTFDGDHTPAADPARRLQRNTGLDCRRTDASGRRTRHQMSPISRSLGRTNHLEALLRNEDLDRVVVFADETDDGPPLQIAGAESVASWKFNSLTNPIRLYRAIKRARVDAVIVNLQFATFGDTKLAGGLGLLVPALLAKTGIPTGVILHNLVDNVDMEDAGFADNKLMARVMNFAGEMLTHTILQADYLLQEKYGATNALLTPHGSFEEITEPKFGMPEGPRKILAFGKFGTYKTVDVLVEAYRMLLDRGYEDIELVIAGTDSPNSPGYLAGVQATCTDLANVEFTGYVEEEDVAGLFESSAVTAFPYTSTTVSSGVLHQAGSYGRAAVLPAIGDFAEVIEEEGFVGLYFEPGDATSLADAIAKMLDDDNLVTEHGRRNFLASTGIPMSEVIDWHLLHLGVAMTSRIQTTPNG